MQTKPECFWMSFDLFCQTKKINRRFLYRQKQYGEIITVRLYQEFVLVKRDMFGRIVPVEPEEVEEYVEAAK